MRESLLATRYSRRLGVHLVLTALLLGSCGPGTTDAADRPLVVATTPVLADLARNIAGEAARVETLIPLGSDPHTFQASARQAASLREADLVVANGLALEAGLSDVLATAAAEGVAVVEVAPLVDPLPYAGSEGSDHSAFDPHFWFDPVRVAEAVSIIGQNLEAVLPGGGWPDRAETYRGRVLAVHAEIEELVSSLPPHRRLLVTNHDSLGYFADRYSFEVVGVIVPGGTTAAAPSARALADLAGLVRELGVPAIFAETTAPEDLARNLAEAVGEEVAVISLYTGSLGEPGSGAETYLDFIRLDAGRIIGALL